MINTISELLEGLIEQEEKQITKLKLNQESALRRMCGTLSKEVLNQAVPANLNLCINSGYIYDPAGYKTRRLDCMLVRGEGLRIGYSTDCMWSIEDVVAILEIKKTIHQHDLKESLESLKDVYQCYFNFIHSGKLNQKVGMSTTMGAFGELTGADVSPCDRDKKLSSRCLYHFMLSIEQMCPIRIILGYDGYEHKSNLQETLKSLISESTRERVFGIVDFPNVILAGSYSLIKINGQPDTPQLKDGYCNFVESTNANPLYLILMFIWMKLGLTYPVFRFEGEALVKDNFSLVLAVKPVRQGSTVGWDYS